MRRRSGWVVTLAAVLIAPAPAADAASVTRVLRYSDSRITESSGLVDLGSTMVTANDSGHAPVLFAVDPHGRTVGTTALRLRRADLRTLDIEALAPAGADRVWVGDIGDNRGSRRTTTLYRVPVARHGSTVVRPTAYRLVYPDHPHDAESLFVDARGRPYVITKSFTGGRVYRAPYPLSSRHPNPLRPVGSVAELATDAAMLPDGRHLLVRSYRTAAVYTFPAMRRVGDVTLPWEPQGEALSVGPGGRVRIGSEGTHSLVEQEALPTALTRGAAASPSPSPSPTRADPGRRTATAGSSWPLLPDGWPLWAVAAVVVAGATGIGLELRRRS